MEISLLHRPIRTVPDTRDPQCKAVRYDADLPSVSVVIIFTNEAWTPLLRTIWSVLDNTPPQHLHEIILVDDFSDKKHLGGKLERCVVQINIIHVLLSL